MVARSRRTRVARECLEPAVPAGDLAERLLRACILLELQETPASSMGLHERLAPFGFELRIAELQRLLEAMEIAGLLVSTWGPHASEPHHHTFHVLPAGSRWLRGAVRELYDAEGFVGAFVARYQERFFSTP